MKLYTFIMITPQQTHVFTVAEPRFQFREGKIKREKIESKIILKNSNSILTTNK